MQPVVLPPKYYLTHFFEFIDFVELQYKSILEPDELRFLNEIRQLSESAQCLFVRMLNRKGRIFKRQVFTKYIEIENLDAAIEELFSKKFIRPLELRDTQNLIEFLTKPQLAKWIQSAGLPFDPNSSRDEMVSFAKKSQSSLGLDLLQTNHLVVQRKEREMDYLLFLFFGRIQKNLTLYTLRDLGIRESQTLKVKFKPRFASKSEARSEYFFAKNLDLNFDEISFEDLKKIYEEAVTYKNLLSSTQNLKNDLLFLLGEHWVDQSPQEAMAAWSQSQHTAARERQTRTLFKLGLKVECQALLEEIQMQPRNDEELLFAEDFSLRKFNKKKLGALTEILQGSKEIALSDFYLKKPELGVCAYFEKLGAKALFAENTIWTSLFGILFWHELFESETAKIHNPFERSPSDLVGAEFYKNNVEKIESKLSFLQNEFEIKKMILRTVIENYGRLNDIFRWDTDLGETLITFVKKSKPYNLAHVLRTMAQNYETHHVGFPDLMIEQDDEIRFVEVKAEGDALRASQLSRMRLLREAGYEVEVLRVRWEADPNQIYVVVDVETTGGSSSFHRVTEIGAVKIQNGKVIDEFQTLINPGRPIPAFITGITGITNEMVAEAPLFSDIAEKFFEFLEGALFVAHNVKFDYGFIQREFEKAGIEFVRANICTCAGMRKTHPGLSSYSLKNLTTHFEIKLDQHHRALSDARAAAELLLIMNGQRQNRLKNHLMGTMTCV